MGGSAKPPKQTDQQQKTEALSMQLMQEQLKQAKAPIVLPDVKPIKPIVPAPPPVTLSSDVAQAAEEARRKAARRTNASVGTIFAGETGGYSKTTKSLLG